MGNKEDIKIKLSEDFAVEILKLSENLYRNKCNQAVITQIVKSGTSIGANIHEALYAESETDFVPKLKIALKEASETKYWLKILFRVGYIEKEIYDDLSKNCTSILKILTSIIKTTQKNKQS